MAAHALHIFPLPLVVFEFEKIHLHIFEPRYKRLVHDCVATDLSFGIPFYYKNKMYGTGAEVRIAEIVKTYESGEMDIVCQALCRCKPSRNRIGKFFTLHAGRGERIGFENL
jgi:Lon protease-like protein